MSDVGEEGDVVMINCQAFPASGDRLKLRACSSQMITVTFEQCHSIAVRPSQLVAAALTLCTPFERERIQREIARKVAKGTKGDLTADSAENTDGRKA